MEQIQAGSILKYEPAGAVAVVYEVKRAPNSPGSDALAIAYRLSSLVMRPARSDDAVQFVPDISNGRQTKWFEVGSVMTMVDRANALFNLHVLDPALRFLLTHALPAHLDDGLGLPGGAREARPSYTFFFRP